MHAFARKMCRCFQIATCSSGGLNTQNVGRAIAAVRPHAVDVCSGVERTPGVKDHRAVENFVAAVRRAARLTETSTAK
ncbi:MAG: hypothetical protein DMF10_03755 [Verrucomicrobia bacterium]|nr:MAG: hypothetical protein DMF10_03755 [Verrucomicrobiota bacterium]